MKNYPIEIGDLCYEIDDIYEVPSSYKLCMNFMIACCKSVLDELPEAAQKGLHVAEQYWSGKGTKKNLISARLTCWDLYDHYNKHTYKRLKKSDSIIVNINKIRSVICVLYEKPEEDETILKELVNFFEFIYEVKNFSDDETSMIIRLMYEYFPEISSAKENKYQPFVPTPIPNKRMWGDLELIRYTFEVHIVSVPKNIKKAISDFRKYYHLSIAELKAGFSNLPFVIDSTIEYIPSPPEFHKLPHHFKEPVNLLHAKYDCFEIRCFRQQDNQKEDNNLEGLILPIVERMGIDEREKIIYNIFKNMLQTYDFGIQYKRKSSLSDYRYIWEFNNNTKLTIEITLIFGPYSYNFGCSCQFAIHKGPIANIVNKSLPGKKNKIDQVVMCGSIGYDMPEDRTIGDIAKKMTDDIKTLYTPYIKAFAEDYPQALDYALNNRKKQLSLKFEKPFTVIVALMHLCNDFSKLDMLIAEAGSDDYYDDFHKSKTYKKEIIEPLMK